MTTSIKHTSFHPNLIPSPTLGWMATSEKHAHKPWLRLLPMAPEDSKVKTTPTISNISTTHADVEFLPPRLPTRKLHTIIGHTDYLLEGSVHSSLDSFMILTSIDVSSQSFRLGTRNITITTRRLPLVLSTPPPLIYPTSTRES